MAYGAGGLYRGTLSAAGNSPDPGFIAGSGYGEGRFNFTLEGTFVATCRLARRFPGGTTWHPCTNAGAIVSFTGPISEVLLEPEPGTQYRLEVTSYTSGTIIYRLSQ